MASTRPVKSAILIDQDLGDIAYRAAYSFLESSLWSWGGCYDLIIPIKDGKIPTKWWSLLYAHSPDFVLQVGEVSKQTEISLLLFLVESDL